MEEVLYLEYKAVPKSIGLHIYLTVYDAFCKAYEIKSEEADRRMFGMEVNKNIIKSGKPSGVFYKPSATNNKMNVRLMVIPKAEYVRFHAYPYEGEEKFSKFKDLATSLLNKRPGLENLVR